MTSLSLALRNDTDWGFGYVLGMADPRHDWYAAHWLKFFGKRQADLVRELDWNKAKASLMLRGLQPYERDSVNELADYLQVEPFELLMDPERAMSFRQYRANAERIVKLAAGQPEVANFKDRAYDPTRHESKPERPHRKTGTD